MIDAVKPGDQIFILQGDRDGVQQIADIIHDNNLHDLSSIQIVSHGGQGEVRLGSTVLTDANLAAHADALSAIGQALTANGDIPLYGCDVGGGAVAASNSSPTCRAILARNRGLDPRYRQDRARRKLEPGSLDRLDRGDAAIHRRARGLSGFARQSEPFGDTDVVAAPGGDVDGDGQVDPGDTMTIAVTITNAGGDASNVQLLSETLSHMTDGGGNDHITPIAFDDA